MHPSNVRASQPFQPMAHQYPRFNAPRRFGQTPRASLPKRSANVPVEKRKLSPKAQEGNGKKSKQQENEKLEKIHRELKEILENTENDNSIIALMKYIQPSQQETHDILMRVTDDIRTVLSRSFMFFDIYPFGSVVTGLLMKDSDLDFYVCLPDPILQEIDQVLRNVERNLWRSRMFTKVIRIPRARVPLLKFLHSDLNVYCDVNFTNSMGIHSSAFIQHLIQLDYRIYPLMMVVKFWATLHKLSGTGRITNYCLVMMVIFFLQSLPKAPLLPPVEVFQRHVPVMGIGGWNAAFDRSLKYSSGNMMCLSKLLGEFFTFVANFDYVNLMMCPLFGKAYKKEDFSAAVEPPEGFELYRAYVLENPEDTLQNLKPLCVQDPFELKMNIGGCCGEKHLKYFITAATAAARIFEQGNLNNENLSQTLMSLFFEKFLAVPMKKNTQKGSHNAFLSIPGVRSKNLLNLTLMPSKAELKLLKELVQRNNINSLEAIKEINKFWVDIMGRFIVSIFKEIYVMQLTLDSQPGNSNSTSSDYPKVFLASTEVNVWSNRKTPGANTAREAEISETKRLQEAIQGPDPLKFSLVLNTNNMYEYLQVCCIDRMMVRNNLRDFHQHFVKSVRTFLNAYLHDYMTKSKEDATVVQESGQE
ncbi:uncharacterized protein LOC132263971 [Phlebotomus argentipes]|uniref:uncharacterized protein LOC132263971 n=1 Tax=Phlebotomus argentipes TaxID=94469 RepID=UPI002892F292|nr:uncharacterized protein LOC132263971 [Phlebotomus argentipes]